MLGVSDLFITAIRTAYSRLVLRKEQLVREEMAQAELVDKVFYSPLER
jgi:hypothetical protein